MSDGHRNCWCPDVCPITLLPFFMWIEHPDRGWIPTYGGPYDSWTIPEPDLPELRDGEKVDRKDIEYTRERFCHDRGAWIECETVEFRVVLEEALIDLGAWG